MTENKPIIDKVNVKECKYYYNGKCERYEEFVEADYANYSVKCICEKENVLGTYDICDYQRLTRKTQECEELKQTLTEIKEIAEKEVKRAPDGETFSRPEIKEILQKISEVEK